MSKSILTGRYRVWMPQNIGVPFAKEPDIIVENSIVNEGWEQFFKMIFQDSSTIAGGQNWFFGLCEQVPNNIDTLDDITTEPDVGVGEYARQSQPRSATGWLEPETINGKNAIRSEEVSFTAIDGAFSRSYNRLFLTDQADGTGGILYSYSGALVNPVLLLEGEVVQFQYEMLANQ